MFDELVAETTATRGAAAVDAWTRVESAACARRLAAMVTMLDDAHAADGSADREQWCIDNWAAVCAHIGAAQRLTSGTASGLLMVGTVLRDRLPKVQAVFAAGLIGYPLVRTIVYRSMLVTDPDAQRALDTALAEALQTWESMSQDRTEQAIDAFIEQVDPLAVRRTQTEARSRSVDIHVEDGSGLAILFGALFAPDATALDGRLDALADTVCPADPRTKDQRRADAMGALAHGADRLMCLCDVEDCPAAANPPSTGVVIYIVADQDTISGPAEPSPDAPHDPDGPDSPDGPQDPDGPDGANDSDDSQVSDSADSAGGTENSDDPHTATDSAADRAAVAECAGLDGHPPPMFSKPSHELIWADLAYPDPGPPATIRPPPRWAGGSCRAASPAVPH